MKVILRGARLPEGQNYSDLTHVPVEKWKDHEGSYDPEFDEAEPGRPLRCYPEFVCGHLYHDPDDGLGDRGSSPHFGIDLVLPPDALARAWDHLRTGPVEAVRLSVYVDVFRSAVDRALAEPDHWQVFEIERETYHNAVQFLWLEVASPAILPSPTMLAERHEPESEPTPDSEMAAAIATGVELERALTRRLERLRASFLLPAWISALALIVMVVIGLVELL